MIELWKDGDDMAILTDSIDEDAFIRDFSEIMSAMIDDGTFEGDWDFQLCHWLPSFVDICCKYRGYKNNVYEKRVLAAGGSGFPNTFKVASLDGNKVKIFRESNRHSQEIMDDNG
jgi:hypothetical protein